MKLQKLKLKIPPSKVSWKPLFGIILFLLIVSSGLPGCSSLTTRSPVNEVGPDPLVVASCPELTPLENGGLATISLKLGEVVGIYTECRTAALAGKK